MSGICLIDPHNGGGQIHVLPQTHRSIPGHREDDLKTLRDIGQRESLIARIRGLIQGYPEGPSILKEFIQNADDAKAKVVEFVLDRRKHGGLRIEDPSEADWI